MRVLFIAGLVFASGFAFGQTAEATFEVASVRPSPPPDSNGRIFFGPARGGPGTSDPVQITWANATLRNILITAYGLQTFQIEAPAWVSTSRYDIVAKVPAGAAKEQVNVMWQSLLKDRFGLVLHHESKEFQVEQLTVAKGGSKLKRTDLGPDAEPFTPVAGPPKIDKNGMREMNGTGVIMTIFPGPAGMTAEMFGKGQSLPDLASKLGNAVGHPVIDKTGLSGKYDFILEYSADIPGLDVGPKSSTASPGDNASDPGSNIASAVEKQLGLKLTTGKEKLDVIVVDRVEKVPTEN